MVRVRRGCFLLLAISTAIYFGCAARRPVDFVSPNFFGKAPAKVAVLPFDNESLELRAPGQLQLMVAAGIRRRGYLPLPPEFVAQKLKEMGLTDGGQLPAVDPQTLGKALGVDGLVYGTIEQFLFQDIGFLLRRIVKLDVRFVYAPTGERLWEGLGDGSTVLAAANPEDVKKLLAVGVAQKTAENIANKPLWNESQRAVEHALRNLPPPAGGRPVPIPPVPPPDLMPAGPPPRPGFVPPPGAAEMQPIPPPDTVRP